mmetsp:Transcript_85890/g.237922  ORF Transcript_85890/g.237922 Transcript_85890/m.237922 type:complete len:119 (-) Transcript_85890:87-443(-)
MWRQSARARGNTGGLSTLRGQPAVSGTVESRMKQRKAMPGHQQWPATTADSDVFCDPSAVWPQLLLPLPQPDSWQPQFHWQKHIVGLGRSVLQEQVVDGSLTTDPTRALISTFHDLST